LKKRTRKAISANSGFASLSEDSLGRHVRISVYQKSVQNCHAYLPIHHCYFVAPPNG